MISTRRALKACQTRDTQTFTISTGPCPQACTGLHYLHSARPCLPGLPCWWSPHAPWASPPRSAQACAISTPWSHAHQACTGLHDLHWDVPLKPVQACMMSAWTVPTKPAKPAIHRYVGSPLCWSVPFRHTRHTVQGPASLPQLKASTHRPVGPPPTCHPPQ
jgi:hypothetical protein